MRLLVDTKQVTFQVTRNPEPKNDQNGRQKQDARTGAPLWSTQVMALDASGGEMLTVTVAGEQPKVSVGMMVRPVELEALPWAQKRGDNFNNGVAYRAAELQQIAAGK